MSQLVMAAQRRILRNPRLRRWVSRTYLRANTALRARRVALDAAFTEGRWQDFIELATQVERSRRMRVSPTTYVRFSASYGQLGDRAAARGVLDRAERKLPWSDVILRALAEWAMHEGDYPRAVVYWQRYANATARRASRGSIKRAATFPIRGHDIDWYEVSWAQVAARWDEWWQQAGQTPSARMYSHMLATLVACGQHEAVVRISAKALRDWPNDEALVLRVCDALVRLGSEDASELVIKTLTGAGASAAASRVAAQMKSAEALIEDLRERGPTGPSELRVLNVTHLSGADFLVRASNYWDERRIAQESLRLAKRDRWPEGFSDTDLLSDRAMEIARQFAQRRGRRIGISDDALARSVFHFIKHELCLKIPADRIAREIAETCGDEPVFVELSSLRVDYLRSYPSSRFERMYLYAALRELGCNAYFVRFPTHAAARTRKFRRTSNSPSMAPLVITPRVDGLRPRFEQLADEPATRSALVPAGVRSIAEVHGRLAPAIVINSASVIKNFAYDRSFRQGKSFPVHAELHPHAHLLPTFKYSLRVTRWWARFERGLAPCASPPPGPPAEVTLGVGTAWTGDWFGLLEQVVLPYFGEYVRAADAFVKERSIEDLHIGDYLYAEPVLLADRVKAHGGRLHLWPHSTNPVHLDFHDPSMVDSVRTITKVGAEAWRRLAPQAEVVQTPELMLHRSSRLVEWRSDAPLSIVVIGGRPSLRNLPILDIAAHESAYRATFIAMEALVDSGAAAVYFKPRGLTGEHESWLDSIVGRTAGWARVLAHPSRIDLPNPVYVSVSVASSALLEGIARGIPGLVVGAGHARDYIGVGESPVEEVPLSEVVQRLGELTTAVGWQRLRESQVDALASSVRGHAGQRA